MSDDACDALDLETYDDKRFDKRLRKLERLARSRRALPRTSTPWRIADLIGARVALSLVERDVLAFALLVEQDAVVAEACEGHARTLPELARIAAPAVGVAPPAFVHVLDPRGALARCGLITTTDLKYDGALTLHDGLKTLLRAPPRDADEALRVFVALGSAPTIAAADVEHLRADVDCAAALVRAAAARSTLGVNVLLWGPPGTGKTETARLIAKEAGVALVEVPMPRLDGTSALSRLGSYEVCQRVIAASRGAVLFDELEDVQRRTASAALLGVADARDKGAFTRLLEENPAPAIWTTNHVDHIDGALLRRFDLVIEMKVPTERVRRRIVDAHLDAALGAGVVDAATRARLAADDRLAPAVVARAARVAALTAPRDVAATVQRLVDNTLRVVAGPRRAQLPVSPLAWDAAFVNASVDVAALAASVARGAGQGVRACLYGPPGTGKTAFARHVAERAHKRLVVKRMSDLLSCWVGATEEAIARMFVEARDEDAVLLLDEADGLLRARDGAARSWEVTQTNELLTQMEAFEGAFFCATNLVDALDPAAFRRFDVKVRFDPLTRAQRRALFLRAFPPRAPLDDVAAHRLDRLEGLAPGHFAAAARRVALLDGDPLAALEEEHRFVRSGARLGFVA